MQLLMLSTDKLINEIYLILIEVGSTAPKAVKKQCNCFKILRRPHLKLVAFFYSYKLYFKDKIKFLPAAAIPEE